MTIEIYDGGAVAPIIAGYPWAATVSCDGLFPSGSTWACDIRATSAGSVLASATVARIDNDSVTVSLTGAQTTAVWAGVSSLAAPHPTFVAVPIAANAVTADLVRTDQTPDRHSNVFLAIDVLQPVTRTGA